MFGFTIGSVSPAASASVKKVRVTRGRYGSTKEMFEKNRTVFSPREVCISLPASKVCLACDCCAETVNVRQSIQTSSFFMP